MIDLFHNVAVREEKAVWREDDARPSASLKIKLDHRRTDDVDGVNDCARIRIEQLFVVGFVTRRIERGRNQGHGHSLGSQINRWITRLGRSSRLLALQWNLPSPRRPS